MITATAILVGSAKLAAATVTVCCSDMTAGAVYTPFAKLPTGGAKLQATPRLLVPFRIALIVVDCPAVNEAVAGVTEMETAGAAGTRDIAAVALLVASAPLVACTVMVWAVEMVAGAV